MQRVGFNREPHRYDQSRRGSPSPYLGQETRALKALSDEEVASLLKCEGMGMANAAELSRCSMPALRFRLGADRNLSDARSEPIAADAREGKDGKRRSELKRIAGLLRVGYDALRRREQQRRNRCLHRRARLG